MQNSIIKPNLNNIEFEINHLKMIMNSTSSFEGISRLYFRRRFLNKIEKRTNKIFRILCTVNHL